MKRDDQALYLWSMLQIIINMSMYVIIYIYGAEQLSKVTQPLIIYAMCAQCTSAHSKMQRYALCRQHTSIMKSILSFDRSLLCITS